MYLSSLSQTHIIYICPELVILTNYPSGWALWTGGLHFLPLFWQLQTFTYEVLSMFYTSLMCHLGVLHLASLGDCPVFTALYSRNFFLSECVFMKLLLTLQGPDASFLEEVVSGLHVHLAEMNLFLPSTSTAMDDSTQHSFQVGSPGLRTYLIRNELYGVLVGNYIYGSTSACPEHTSLSIERVAGVHSSGSDTSAWSLRAAKESSLAC